MYAISRLTQDFLEKHSKIFGMLEPCFFMLCGNTPHSYDLFRRTVFFGENNAAAFIAADKDTKSIKAVIVFNQFGKENNSVFMHIIPVGADGFDDGKMTEALKSLMVDTVKKFGLYSIYSNVMGAEERIKRVLEAAGFQKEAELKEQVCAGGRMDSVIVYTLFSKDLINA